MPLKVVIFKFTSDLDLKVCLWGCRCHLDLVSSLSSGVWTLRAAARIQPSWACLWSCPVNKLLLSRCWLQTLAGWWLVRVNQNKLITEIQQLDTPKSQSESEILCLGKSSSWMNWYKNEMNGSGWKHVCENEMFIFPHEWRLFSFHFLSCRPVSYLWTSAKEGWDFFISSFLFFFFYYSFWYFINDLIFVE